MVYNRVQRGDLPVQDEEVKLSQSLAKLGYMGTAHTVSFTRRVLNLKDDNDGNSVQNDEVQNALRSILPKFYTGKSALPALLLNMLTSTPTLCRLACSKLP